MASRNEARIKSKISTNPTKENNIMIVNVKDLVSYAIKKQFKISHVPCEVMVFDKDEIPESIKSKIED